MFDMLGLSWSEDSIPPLEDKRSTDEAAPQCMPKRCCGEAFTKTTKWMCSDLSQFLDETGLHMTTSKQPKAPKPQKRRPAVPPLAGDSNLLPNDEDHLLGQRDNGCNEEPAQDHVAIHSCVHTVVIKTLSGERLCSIAVSQNMVVKTLKECIAEATRMPVGVQRLVAGTHILKNTEDVHSQFLLAGHERSQEEATLLLVAHARRCNQCGTLCGGKYSECLVESWVSNGFDEAHEDEDEAWICDWCETAASQHA